jgi:hypothetical protein
VSPWVMGRTRTPSWADAGPEFALQLKHNNENETVAQLRKPAISSLRQIILPEILTIGGSVALMASPRFTRDGSSA